MSVPKIDYNTDKAIKALKAEKAFKAFTKYMNARELTTQAIEKNKNAIDKSQEALIIYNKNKDDPESKAYLHEMNNNIRLASEALNKALADEAKAKIYSDKMSSEAMV
jgi:hypothetical protein